MQDFNYQKLFGTICVDKYNIVDFYFEIIEIVNRTEKYIVA